MQYNRELLEKTDNMYCEAKEAIIFLEEHISNLYTAEGLYRIFKDGFSQFLICWI